MAMGRDRSPRGRVVEVGDSPVPQVEQMPQRLGSAPLIVGQNDCRGGHIVHQGDHPQVTRHQLGVVGYVLRDRNEPVNLPL